VCWGGATETNILIASSNKLSSDIIDNYQVTTIPRGSIKLSVRYSILVKQHALTSQAYEFFRRLKKNTEETGSVFDAQPSELKSNIHCVSNPDEQVVGYVDVSSEETKRIFIKKSDVPDWQYNTPCALDTIALLPTEIQPAAGIGLVPISFAGGGFTAALPVCVDCTRTGTDVKPPFWP